jgi:multicomponent K+:H+ antiporter subunit A
MYARYYLSSQDSAPRFFAYLLLFMGAMLGMVVAGNLLLLVVFWELTSISSFLLIGYWSHREDARDGARMALTITGAGGLALLGGVLLIGRIVGSYELDVVLASGDLIRAHALYPWALGWCCWASSPRARSSRSTSGCRTRWRRRRRCRPTCTRRRW